MNSTYKYTPIDALVAPQENLLNWITLVSVFIRSFIEAKTCRLTLETSNLFNFVYWCCLILLPPINPSMRRWQTPTHTGRKIFLRDSVRLLVDLIVSLVYFLVPWTEDQKRGRLKFLARPFFLGRFLKDSFFLSDQMLESCSCDLRGKKKKVLCCCFCPPQSHLTPIISQVIDLLGFTHSFHALRGLVVVALNCGLIIVLVYPPNTQSKHRHPHRDSCHTKLLNWYVYSKAGALLFSVYQGERAQCPSRRHRLWGAGSYLHSVRLISPQNCSSNNPFLIVGLYDCKKKNLNSSPN